MPKQRYQRRLTKPGQAVFTPQAQIGATTTGTLGVAGADVPSGRIMPPGPPRKRRRVR
jgi:hypothetical protein